MLRGWLVGVAAVLSAAAGRGSPIHEELRVCADPGAALLMATFQVGPESFRACITDPAAMRDARALWLGRSTAAIPVGVIIPLAVEWNQPWSWHLDPASVEFAEVSIEVCDALPSDLEQRLGSFGRRYCPWGAVLTSLASADGAPVPRAAPTPEPAAWWLCLAGLAGIGLRKSRAISRRL